MSAEQTVCPSCRRRYSASRDKCPFCKESYFTRAGAFLRHAFKQLKKAWQAPINPHQTEASAASTAPRGKFICRACGHRGKIKTKVKGRLEAEVILWVLVVISLYFSVATLGVFLAFFMIALLVALGYSGWRLLSSRQKVCPECGQEGMIPVDSPIGQRLAAEYFNPPFQDQ